MPETKPRKFRIPDDLWAALQQRAADEHIKVTTFVIRALWRAVEH